MRISSTFYQFENLFFLHLIRVINGCNNDDLRNKFALKKLEHRIKELEKENVLKSNLEKIKNGEFSDSEIFNYNLVIKEFLEKIVDNKNATSIFVFLSKASQHEAKIFDQKYFESTENYKPEEFEIYKEKTDQFYEEIKKIFVGLGCYNRRASRLIDPIKDLSHNKNLYKIFYLEEDIKSCFDEFWNTLINTDNSHKNYSNILVNIYFKKCKIVLLNVCITWLKHKCVSFLVDKYLSLNDKSIKEKTFNALKDLCNSIGIRLLYYIPNINEIYTLNEPGEQNQKNLQKMRSLKPVIDLKLLKTLDGEMWKITAIIDSEFNERMLDSKYLTRKMHISEFNHGLLLFINTLTKIFSKIGTDSEEFFIKNEIYVKSKVLHSIYSLIMLYRSHSIRYIMLQIIICSYNLNTVYNLENFHDESGKYGNFYLEFIHSTIIFEILNSSLPKKFVNLCLDTISYPLDYYALENPKLFPNYENSNHEERKNFFLKTHHRITNLIVQNNSKVYEKFYRCTVEQLNNIKDKKRIVIFILFLISFRFEMENIVRHNFLSCKNQLQDYLLGVKNENGDANKNSEKCMESLRQYRAYFVLYTHKKVTELKMNDNEFYDQLISIKNLIKNLDDCNGVDLKFLIKYMYYSEFYDETDFKMLRCEFSDVQERLGLYFKCYTHTGRLFRDQIAKRIQTYASENFWENQNQNDVSSKCNENIDVDKENDSKKSTIEQYFGLCLKKEKYIDLYFIKHLCREIEDEFRMKFFKHVTPEKDKRKKNGLDVKILIHREKLMTIEYFSFIVMILKEPRTKNEESNSIHEKSVTYTRKFIINTTEPNFIIVLKYRSLPGNFNRFFTTIEEINHHLGTSTNDAPNLESFSSNTTVLYIYQEENEQYFQKICEYVSEVFELDVSD